MLRVAVGLCLVVLPALAAAEDLTLPIEKRPEWLRRDGIVMAGSWEPLLFRVRRDGGDGYTPSAEQLAAYRREHSPEMVQRLKSLGVNFVMMHCYKGGGLAAERESMADAVAFARLCHQQGIKVGVYNYSGAFIWELFFREVPEAKDWLVLKADGAPLVYGRTANYRYYWNRNHPAAEEFYRTLVRFAVEEIQADLIHFDNHNIGPGWDACSLDRFRAYLKKTFSADELRAAAIDPATARPPEKPTEDLLWRAWADFCCASLAESYGRMCRYARGLRPDVLLECNPAGVRPAIVPPVDHGRLLQGGEAYWDESRAPSYKNGKLTTRIRTYKVARRMNNAAFAYMTGPLEAAESMAFNLDCLGAICWFEYANIVDRPGSTTPYNEALGPYVRFFHQRRDLYRDAAVVADVAVLHNFASQVFGPRKTAQLAGEVEDALIAARRPFQIIFDQHLGELDRYRAVVLAGCAALGDEQAAQLRRFVEKGGRLCVAGPLGTHDAWMRPRAVPALEGLPADRVVRLTDAPAWPQQIDAACGGRPLSVEGPAALCCELAEQPARRLLHLVNYNEAEPAAGVKVRLALPAGKQAARVVLASPERPADVELPFQQTGDSVVFDLPPLGVYAIAAVEW